MKKNIKHLKMNESIDRINLNAHRNDSYLFIDKIKEECSLIKVNKIFNYTIYKFNYKNNYIQVYYKIVPNPKNPNERFYVQLLQPDHDTQIFIYKILKNLCFNNFYKQFNPSIRAVEVSHDFFGTEEELNELHAFFTQYLNLKHSRSGSVGWYKNTSYRGKNGNARKGYMGSRCYIKHLPDGTIVCRLEVQFNGRYLSEKKFTIEDLPLTPEYFNALSHFEMLDNFSDQGIRNLAQTLLRKKGKRFIARDKGHQFKLPMMEQWLRWEIFGAWHEDDYVPVPEQIDRVKRLIKKYGLKVTPKKYFQPQFDLAEVVAALLADQQAELPVSDSTEFAECAREVLTGCSSTQLVTLNGYYVLTQDSGHDLLAHLKATGLDIDGRGFSDMHALYHTGISRYAATSEYPKFAKAQVPSNNDRPGLESPEKGLRLTAGVAGSVVADLPLASLAPLAEHHAKVDRLASTPLPVGAYRALFSRPPHCKYIYNGSP